MSYTISIVIPVYNREIYLGAAIESVLNQTRCDFELLIWDDGSTDRSLEIAHYYTTLDPRIRVIAAAHQGVAVALKQAFAETTGKYIASVDSDDLLAPTALEATAAILDEQSTIGLVYTDYHVVDADGQDKGLGLGCNIPYSKNRLLIDFMTFHFRLLRRYVYDQVGGIDTSFEQAEDYDLCLKVSEVTQVYHLAQPLYYHRRHSTNITNQRLELIQWTAKASSQALKRRGLDDQYELDVQIVGQFRLQRKKLHNTITTNAC
ncbi:glycosyltransferase [Cyanobacteria bacterium FACHB-DQ100]|nr:glycosyltransferase [Cyanobacteria bacterium FACHB-DQ100]